MLPVVAAVGAELPHGTTIISQLVATPLFVHPKTAEFVVMFVAVKVVGVAHVGAAEQVTFATHPAIFTEPSLLNLKVKQPLASVEVKGPGIAVPQYPPGKPPGTFAAKFELAICGAEMVVPLKT